MTRIKELIIKKPPLSTIFRGKNGDYSSKRIFGFFLIITAIYFAYNNNNQFAETCIYAGAGLISAGVLERKNSESNSTDEMG